MVTRHGGCSNVGRHGREGHWRSYRVNWLTAGLQGYHPQSHAHAFAPAPAHNCAATMCDDTPNFGEE